MQEADKSAYLGPEVTQKSEEQYDDFWSCFCFEFFALIGHLLVKVQSCLNTFFIFWVHNQDCKDDH